MYKFLSELGTLFMAGGTDYSQDIRCLRMMWKWWLNMTTSPATCSTLLPS